MMAHMFTKRNFDEPKLQSTTTLGFTDDVLSQVMTSLRAMAHDDGTLVRSKLIEFMGNYALYFADGVWPTLSYALANIRDDSRGGSELEDIRRLLVSYLVDEGETLPGFKFELNQEMYEDGVQYISIFDNKGSRFEIRIWSDILEYEAYSKAEAADVIDVELYKIISKYSTLEKTANTWKEIRQR